MLDTYGGLLDAVRGVHWPSRRAVSAGATGTHHSRMRGTSAEFTEYRLYRQGDDPRRLDWRLLARSDRAYIRLATDRAVLPTTIVLDASSSMAFPIATRAKWHFAQAMVVGLAAIVHADGDPVGVAVHDHRGQVRVLQPRTRRGVVAEIAQTIDDADPDGHDPLAPVVAAVRTARIAIVTDLLGDADPLIRAAGVHIAGGGEVHLVHVVSREELDPPRRAILAADPEEPVLKRLLTDSTRREYVNAYAEWRNEMAHRWRSLGAGYTEVIDDEDPARSLRRIVESRPLGAEGR